MRRDSRGVGRSKSRDSIDLKDGLLTGLNADGAALEALEGSLGTGSLAELRSRGPCRLVLDI